MMSDNTIALLRATESAIDRPRSFDDDVRHARFVRRRVAELSGVAAGIDLSVANGEHFGSLSVTRVQGAQEERVLCVFSLTASLVAVRVLSDATTEDLVHDVSSILADEGFTPLPYEHLLRVYDGNSDWAYGTWFNRFFAHN